jgi:hypothetical protein
MSSCSKLQLIATDQLHANPNHSEFTGPYVDYRKRMDSQYFVNYKISRQLYQDQIIAKYLTRSHHVGQSQIIFTQGPFGAGKSYVMKYLQKQGLIDLSQYIYIDPDQLKYELPEAPDYIKQDPMGAGSLLHMESSYLSLLLQYIILDQGNSMIIDGSMRDIDWHIYYIKWLQEHYPHYKLAIIKVEAEFDRVLQRCRKRGEQTGRMIPEDLIRDTYKHTNQAFLEYAKLIPSQMIVQNDTQPQINHSTFLPFVIG